MPTTNAKVPIVRDFMTRQVVTVEPDMIIYDAIKVLLDHRISGAPVIETGADGRRLLGILSEKDCMSILTNGVFYGLNSARVRDYMTTEVVSIVEDMDIFAVADIFLRNAYRRLPVIDDHGLLIGVVSRRDILDASKGLWGENVEPPDPGYLPEAVKAKLGESGMARLRKKLQY